MGQSGLKAGSAAVEVTPLNSMFMAGYPHVRRDSTGVHDPLLSSALYLENGPDRVLLIANDVIYISKVSTARCRETISQQTGIRAPNILISATHTHSGPKTLDPIATEADASVPKTDATYVRWLEDRIVAAAAQAVKNATLAEAGLAVADATGVGTNRRDPNGAKDLAVPVLVVRNADTHRPLAAILVCSMHPTMLHEDSTLISGDFPGLARQQLQRNVLGNDCVILYHTGPAGDQSPRHVTRENTFAEAERLGAILADAAAKVIPTIQFSRDLKITCRSSSVNLPLRSFPSESESQKKLAAAVERLAKLRGSNAPRTQIRTAEVDWFGAEETLTLSRAASSGRLAAVAASVMPAEVHVIRIGPWNFVAWPGEMFVEFGLQIKRRMPNTFILSYTNGELQGYLVTQQAVDEGGYESSNAIFQSPESGNLLVAKTLELLA